MWMDKPKRIVAIVLASLILTSLTCLAAEPRAKPIANPKAPQSQGDIFDKISESASSAATSVFEQVSNSVVIVEAVSSAGGIQGSGVVYQNKSFGTKREDLFSQVVTNAHVIKNADSVSVLQGNKRYQADIDYVDSEFDLALLSVQGVLLPVSPPSSGAQLKVGEKVFAIGSPLGLENSISEGIISGKREQSGVSLLQTTAPVSKGSSGGGLFDTKGRFVGITTFKLMGGENLNFAVDAGRVSEIDDAQDAAMTLLVSGHRSRSRDELDALTEWLLKAPTENAEKLSTKIKRIWNSTEPVNKVEKECVQILERFLREQVGETAKSQNKPETVVEPEAPQRKVHFTEPFIPSEKKSKKDILSLPCHGSDPAAILYCLESLAGTALPSRCIGTTAEQICYCGYFLAAGQLDLSKGVVEPPDENYKEAILYYNIAIQVDAKYVPAYVARGEAYLKLGNYQQAIKDCNKALGLNPIFDKAYNMRGLVYANLRNYRQAIRDFDKAIELNPKFSWAYSNRANAYENLGDVVHAIEDWKTAAKLGDLGAQAELRRRGIN